jgi:Ser/Thr protein kinase RdoA (MazF antagonist)
MESVPHQLLIRILANWFAARELDTLQVCEIPGGLSGAKLWRIVSGRVAFCLRQWPDICLSAYELAQIHGLITHVWSTGLRIVPFPRRTHADLTFINVGSRMWELADWLPGEIVEQPDAEQTVEAIKTLARFHQHAASYQDPKTGRAPGLEMRNSLLTQLQEGQLSRIKQAAAASRPTELRELALTIVKDIDALLPSVLNTVKHAALVDLPLQWCLRDVHLGNLLYVGNEVTGVVDFGGATVDSVAGDIARLMRSLVPGASDAWQRGLAGYESVRPLSLSERQAIRPYDAGGLVCAAANWLRWLFIEHREFAAAASTRHRLFELSERLKSLQIL